MTSAQKIIDQELAQFGWVESIATNSISDFKSPKSPGKEEANAINPDFLDKFILHLIFYMIFCYSLFIYVVIDLGFASFVKRKVNRLIKFEKNLRGLFYYPNPIN